MKRDTWNLKQFAKTLPMGDLFRRVMELEEDAVPYCQLSGKVETWFILWVMTRRSATARPLRRTTKTGKTARMKRLREWKRLSKLICDHCGGTMSPNFIPVCVRRPNPKMGWWETRWFCNHVCLRAWAQHRLDDWPMDGSSEEFAPTDCRQVLEEWRRVD